MVVTIWVFFLCICLWWHSFATEHVTEVSSPSVTYERNVLEDLSALLYIYLCFIFLFQFDVRELKQSVYKSKLMLEQKRLLS